MMSEIDDTSFSTFTHNSSCAAAPTKSLLQACAVTDSNGLWCLGGITSTGIAAPVRSLSFLSIATKCWQTSFTLFASPIAAHSLIYLSSDKSLYVFGRDIFLCSVLNFFIDKLTLVGFNRWLKRCIQRLEFAWCSKSEIRTIC